MIDGQTQLQLTSSISVTDDSNTISLITIQLDNPYNAESERISVTIPDNIGISLVRYSRVNRSQ